MPKKVLIITYYWPPSGGSGVQRWLKFVKYLRDFGWEPVIFKPEKAEYPEIDPSLEKDIPKGIETINSPIWEPYQLYKTFTGRNKKEKVQVGFLNEKKKTGRLEKFAIWLRGNIFIPDARKYWIKPGAKALDNWLSKNSVDVIVSTGPPHSAHIIAQRAHRKHNIPWLADFRDPWTQIDFYDQLLLSDYADKKHKKLELSVLQEADKIVTVSQHCAIGLNEISGEKIEVITNGYDKEDFSNNIKFDHKKFSITHLGSMNADRNPKTLWKALGQLNKEIPDFKEHLEIRFIGKTDISVFDSLEENGLADNVLNLKYLPHDEALEKASNSAILLLALNDTPNVLSLAPGKLYEYLALHRPVLCTGAPDGDAANILSNAQSGKAVGFEDLEGTSDQIRQWFELYQNNELELDATSIDQYSRRSLTKEMSALLDELVGKH